MDVLVARRKRAAARSREAGLRAKHPSIQPVGECDHLWDADGVCLRCDQQVIEPRCESDAQYP